MYFKATGSLTEDPGLDLKSFLEGFSSSHEFRSCAVVQVVYIQGPLYTSCKYQNPM